MNHYLTSDRFLDDRLERYPATTYGGNERQRYADVEAVRVLTPPPTVAGVLREAWERYGRPIAVTEAHNGSTRDEQMRWMADVWDTAKDLRQDGVHIDAVTSWSLLGSSGWNTLLTGSGAYEAGAYEVSGGAVRPTALVPLLKGLASGAQRHPVLAGEGWWRRPVRLAYPATPHPEAATVEAARVAPLPPPPLLICGATGTLGQAIAGACVLRDIRHVLLSRAQLDLASSDSIAAALDEHAPWAVINAAGWVRVDDAESEADACFAANASGAIALARECAARGIPTVSFSSDLVFDGATDRAYVESDPVCPLNAYGRSKAAMEHGIDELPGSHLIVRTAAFFSPFDGHNFAVAVARTLSQGQVFVAADDQIVSPTYVPQLVSRTLDLIIDGVDGIWHLANDEAVSWAEFARLVADACGLDAAKVQAVPSEALNLPAPRPRFAALASQRGPSVGSLQAAIRLFGRFDMHTRAEIARAA